VVHILHYPIERRAQIDIIEDVIPLYDKNIEVLCDYPPSAVYLAPSREPAEYTCAGGVVTIRVREIKGHQMVALEK
jgi:hypothetical protein